MLTPYENKVDVITPINILFIGGGEFRSVMDIYIYIVDVIAPSNILFREGGEC